MSTKKGAKAFRVVVMHTCGLVEVYEKETQAEAIASAKELNDHWSCPEMGVDRTEAIGCEPHAYCLTVKELQAITEA